ncbi:hypothetical protein OH76DRAFT_1485832 [Lentinus brumalis]|uniref:Uncharacterized protein n=1 Tax=Lentinus brumalis TaxID=2498619 RepID=A0A371D0H8_9APHY|nr:hypothetical protein OH76DRAFT_1485832 [Polyporus brumalis]
MPSPFALPVYISTIPLPAALQAEFDAIVNVLETVFPTVLIPLAICLFMFTKPEIQRKPIFILNVLSIMLGLVFGGIAIATMVSRHPAFIGAECAFIGEGRRVVVTSWDSGAGFSSS